VLSVCQKLSKLVEIWQSYGKNNFAVFFETQCIYTVYIYCYFTSLMLWSDRQVISSHQIVSDLPSVFSFFGMSLVVIIQYLLCAYDPYWTVYLLLLLHSAINMVRNLTYVVYLTIRYDTIYYLHWKTDRQAASLI